MKIALLVLVIIVGIVTGLNSYIFTISLNSFEHLEREREHVRIQKVLYDTLPQCRWEFDINDLDY